MASPEQGAAVAAAVVENVMRLHSEGGVGLGVGGGETVGAWRNIDIAWRKAEEAAIRRYEAANWLRRIVGVVSARDLAEEPSEDEFRIGLRNGIILCNALNKVQPGSVPKVVEVPSDSTVPTDGAALCAYQYFENVRNFVIGLQDLGLPTFEASDLEKGGKGVRVVDCVLALKSFCEAKQVGKQSSSFKHGGIIKPLSGTYFIRKNTEPFMKAMIRSHSAELLRDGISQEPIGHEFSLESTETTSDSIRMLVQTVLSDKKPEEVPSIVESLLSKVIHEFESRIANQNESVRSVMDSNESNTVFRTDSPEVESKSTCDQNGEDPCILKEDVSTLTPRTQNDNSVQKLVQSRPETNFDQQQKQIQDLKNNLCTIKSGMEDFKLLYCEDLTKLGNHLRVISHAASGYHKLVEENRKLYNQIQDLRGNIRVYCRVRPFLPGKVSSSSSVDGIEDRTITILVPSKYGKDARKSFTFNRVFGPLATQEEVFSDMQPLIRSVLDGFNVCIFAYGQTGSGKTFTMSGPKILTDEGLGVNYRALNDLFSIQEQRKDTFCYEISVQMIEIYNEQKNRAVCSTAMNDRSSRSHSCLTVHVQGRDLTSGTVMRGCMHLVDLAGSERVDKSEVVGDRLKEAQHINKSLAALGDVIASLAQKNTHVPYRNSKLTQFLQDSLGGQAKTLMFVHIAPEPDAVSESISTLKFAERVATVELGAAKSNKEGAEVKELKEQIACLRAALARKDVESDHIRSTQSSPDIYRMRMGKRHSVDEVGNVEKESSLRDWADNSHFGSSNSLPELGPDGSQDLAFYQRSSPEQQWSWSGSVATEDSDDFEVATSCSSEQDCVRPASAPKASGFANGAARKGQSKGLKSSDIRGVNPAKKTSPLQKKLNGPSPMPIKKSAVEGKRTPNGKVSAKK
ncbi:hypothetical protein QOZ80_9BG0718300 [Eleusine coracana subsp. coracana]|nr:hypothetical protein QOZ80_9BG0718300 [Eleusine coracana subsp. coracana]